MASRLLSAEDVLDQVFDASFGLDDSDDSDLGGDGVQGYLPMDSLNSMSDGELGEGGDRSGGSDGDEEMAYRMIVDSEDSSDGSASCKSTIQETKYDVWNLRLIV